MLAGPKFEVMSAAAANAAKAGSAAPVNVGAIRTQPPNQHRASSTASSPAQSQQSVFELSSDGGTVAGENASVPTVLSSLNVPEAITAERLGYKDELERRFIWDRVIGHGRHGTVVRAVVDRADGTEFACKCMPKIAPADCVPDNTPEARTAANELQLEHIRREINLFTRLRSSLNVAKLEQVYEDDSHVYLVMEMCRGKSLSELAEEENTPEQDVSTYMRSVVRTIAQCHEVGEVHGAPAPNKFRLLSEDRDAQLKATGFGRLGATTGASAVYQTCIHISAAYELP
jgi:hypothetical protein